MAKAEIKLASGTLVTIEGTVEEVDRVIALYESPSSAGEKKVGSVQPSRRIGNGQTMASPGPMNLIRELKQEGFFDAKQTLKSVSEKLAEQGHIYSDATVGKSLQRLTQSRILGRIREGGVWKYVRR